MAYDRGTRQAISKLSNLSIEAWKLIERLESESIVAPLELCKVLEKSTVHLIGISCATGTEDEKDLNVTNSIGFFDRRTRQKTEFLLTNLREVGKEVRLTLFVEDTEWTRAWGWNSRTQEDLRLEAWMQIEEAREAGKAPPGEILFWSEVEPRILDMGLMGYEDGIIWASEPEQSLALDTDIRYRMTIPKLQHARRVELELSSCKRLASYASTGQALEMLYPDSIFVQSADSRTDHMLQRRRKKPMPIIHPWR